MRVFVTGGTGAVGWPTVEALVAADHRVTALARSSAKASALEERGASPVLVSLFDTDALTRAFAGHQAVVNLATALPATHRFTSLRAWQDNVRIRTEGSRCVATAARQAGVERLVQESVAMIYPDRGAEWITEDVEPDRFPMADSNLAAEASAERFTESGGNGITLRFGWFHGPGATHSEEFLALARRHVCFRMGAPDGYVSSIHVQDAGRAVEAVLEAPAGIYNVVDDEPLTKADFADALAAAVGTRCWIAVPGRLALVLGHRTTSLTRSLRVANAKLRHTTTWTPRFPSAREGLAQTATVLLRGA